MSKILIVEDTPLNRELMQRRLEKRGYETILACDGAQALSMAALHVPDIILLDLSIPEIDGWEVARRLKNDPQLKQIPIIALTAHAMFSDREKAIAAGCDDFELKPIDFSRILGKIKDFLKIREGMP
ncbi:MAG: response regulator [Candidatus Riflebacteria bacterium]|nr:response regulator [Candidatus Riflebacteria bacterium]